MQMFPDASLTVFRLRCSSGMKTRRWKELTSSCDAANENFVLSTALNRHSTFAVELRHDDSKPLRGEFAYLQTALLFTGTNGERRIRVLTRQLPVVDDLTKLAQTVNPPAVLAMSCKQACVDMDTVAVKDVVAGLQTNVVETLLAERAFCPPPLKRTKDDLILFRPLALLPLFALSLMRSPPFNPLLPQRLSPDAACAQLQMMRQLPIHLCSLLLMPRLYVLQRPAPPSEGLTASPQATPPPKLELAADSDPASKPPAPTPAPTPVPSSAAFAEVLMPSASEVSQEGIYLLDCLQELVIWVGAQASPSFVKELFGTSTPEKDAELLPADENSSSRRVHELIDGLRSQRPQHAPLVVLLQGNQLQQPRFFSRLFAEGYEPFMLQVHSRVAPKL